ncbi:MAG: inositol monophosphatase family protein [Candidatus Binatia bacterium]|nr:inositol monophosphatase family protein [Candidatus Binatia bacterium]
MSTERSTKTSRPRSPFDARGLARLARRAGAIAIDNAATTSGTRPPAERVTRAIESWISREAQTSQPRTRVALTHETGPLPKADWVLSVDAIDGLDAYLAGLPTWAVSLGLLYRGEPFSAAVYAPALRDLYVASSGTLRWQGRAVTADATKEPSRFVLGTGLEKRSILRLRRRREAEGPIFYHACLVARGAAEGAVLGRLNHRQAATLAALLGPVGGELVSVRTGKPLDLTSLLLGRSTRDPILATGAGRAEALFSRLKK